MRDVSRSARQLKFRRMRGIYGTKSEISYPENIPVCCCARRVSRHSCQSYEAWANIDVDLTESGPILHVAGTGVLLYNGNIVIC